MVTGGICPAVRKRSRLALSLAEREEISRGLVAGFSLRSIAERLMRSPSTVSREIKHNGGRRGYRAVKADKRAWEQALRPKACKLVLNDRLRQAVIRKLKHYWSPQQIAGWLKRAYANSKAMNVSHETIYRSLYVQARGALKKELISPYQVIGKANFSAAQPIASSPHWRSDTHAMRCLRNCPVVTQKPSWMRSSNNQSGCQLNSTKRSLGIVVLKWRIISGSAWKRRSMSTSVTPRAPGNVD